MAFQLYIPKHLWIHSIITKFHFPRLNTYDKTHINYMLLHIYTTLHEKRSRNQTLKSNRNTFNHTIKYIFTNDLVWPTTAQIFFVIFAIFYYSDYHHCHLSSLLQNAPRASASTRIRTTGVFSQLVQ